MLRKKKKEKKKTTPSMTQKETVCQILRSTTHATCC